MSRERITGRALKASDPSFGQSANNYWRTRARDAIWGALSEVEKELYEQAQEVTNEQAQELGVEPAQLVPEGTPTHAEVDADPSVEAPMEEISEDVKMAMVFEPRKKEAAKKQTVFEPRKKEAGAPVDPSAIAKENWFQMQEKFPQYTKQKKLTMLAVAPTKRNTEAVSAVTDTLDEIASKLEENGDVESATQIDVISDLLTASVDECKRIAAKSKEEK